MPALVVALTALATTAGAGASDVKVSTAKDRKEVSITVYNSNFGLVRETREIELGQGRVALEFRDVAAQIQAETVSIKGASADSLRIFEQNYRYDLLSPETLLAKYVGKKIKIYRWNQQLGKEDAFDAEVLSVNGGQPVLKMGNEITYGFPGRFAFPEVPANLALESLKAAPSLGESETGAIIAFLNTLTDSHYERLLTTDQEH